jgi:type IV pilus assembly protein PilC
VLPTGNRLLFGVSLRHRVFFYQQLDHLLKAGIPLILALAHLENQMPAHLRPMLHAMSERLQRGEPLSVVMSSYAAVFSEWEVHLIHAAELTGDLHMAANQISVTLEMEETIRRRLNSSTIHLWITLAVLVVVLCIVRIFLGRAVSAGDAIFLLGGAIRDGLVMLALAVLAWQGYRMWSRTRRGSLLNAAILFRLPLVGTLIFNQMRIRFTRVLGALWNAGVAPMEALQTAARASGHGRVIRVVEENLHRVGEGQEVSNIIEASQLYPPEAVYLLRTGETSGSVPAALEKIAEYFQGQLETQAKVLPTQLYFLFFIIVALVAGYFIISYFIQGVIAPMQEYLQ